MNENFLDMLIDACAKIGVLLLCFPIHECAHAYVANKLGDPTGKEKGRITLNPFKHLDWFGALTILAFGFGYAKPVPVNITKFKKPKLYFALTALAGPVSNLIMAVILAVVCRVLCFFYTGSGVLAVIIACLDYAAYVNISLAVFNLIPVPPLDGSRLLMAALPDKTYVKFLKSEKYLVVALFAVIFILNRIGFSPLSIISQAVYNLIFGIFF